MANEERQDEFNKELRAKMEFIVNQQAQFSANIQAHEERLTRLENIVTRLATVTLEGQEKLTALTTAQIKTEEAIIKLAESQAQLVESQAHTDKRLDILIDIVREERERRNGRNDKS
jgi:hypothetical protein